MISGSRDRRAPDSAIAASVRNRYTAANTRHRSRWWRANRRFRRFSKP